ncbi:MAG: DNA methyltransferase [Mycoplasmataceae bacterium RV_VA103A]|nr:MAG: DNA methyltransferase [Mycoplasmataceae bacterium RV_VA103A]
MNKEQELIASLQQRIKELENEREEFTAGGIKILFSGKANAQQVARKVKPRTLKEVSELSIGSEEEKNKNLVIEGDNLWAMVTLYQYHGKVDLIITDPPYNTGKDFRYNDKWDEEPNDEGLGDYVESNDTSRHTKWMKFMLPRLQMMWKMLKPSGVLAICIGEGELLRLGMMLNEIFGEQNRVAMISWQKAYAPKLSLHVSSATDYVLVYAKSFEKIKTGKLGQTEAQKSRFSNPDNDPKGEWRSTTSLIKMPNQRQIYAIQNPFTGLLIYPFEGNSWRYSKKTMKPLLEEWGSEYEEKELNDGCVPGLILKGFDLKNLENPEKDPVFQKAREKAQYIYDNKPWPRLIYLKKGLGKIRFKLYFAEVQDGVTPLNWWNSEDYETERESVSWHHQISGYTQQGTAELKARMNLDKDYIGVKPLKLFQKIIQLWCPLNGLILDPFAGSGTTGEVVFQLNKELNSRERERERERRFILIEQGNPKNGDNYCRTLLQKRLKAVITGRWADQKEHEPLGGGFKFLTLDKTIDETTLLKMERKEIIEAIFSSQITSLSLIPEDSNLKYLIAKNKQEEGIFLIWNGNSNSQLTQDIYYQITREAQQTNLSTNKYNVYARLCSFSTSSIEFEQIPEKILQDLGAE